MMNKTRIVFFGTPDFAVGILEALVQNKFSIVGVVTAVDKPAGRGKKIRMSSVKLYALENEIPILQPRNLKNEDFLKELASLSADLQIIVAFRMLPKQVWNMPKMGTFNLHASLLPAYRGAAPIHWAIINGETETGVTTFFIDDKIDTGAILLQQTTSIGKDETVGELHDKLMETGSQLVVETVNLLLSGVYQTQPQPDIAPKLAPKLFKDNTRIDWNAPLDHIYNMIRGLNPFPVAWSRFISDNKEYKIKLYRAHVERITHQEEIGCIITTKKTLKVATEDGFLCLDEVQLSGKKKMDVNSLLNGFSFSDDAKMCS